MKSSNVAPALALYTSSTNDPELRFRLIEAAANLFGAEGTRTILLDAWAKNTPNDPYAALVRAKWIISSAPSWSPNDPEDVADAARAANTAAAKQALAEYQRIAALAPQDPVPWALMLQLPLIFELEGKQGLYNEVTRRFPGFFPAQLAMHHALTAMWYGDHNQSVNFMRGVASAAPPGSDLHALVPYGHFRVFGYEKFFGAGPEAAKQLISNPAIQQECLGAFERSLWSPQYRPGYWSLWAASVAAIWFDELGDAARAKAAFEKLGDAFDEDSDPWNCSTATFANIRAKYIPA